VYPKAFLDFLDLIGIDPSKEGEEDMLAGQADSADVRRGTSCGLSLRRAALLDHWTRDDELWI